MPTLRTLFYKIFPSKADINMPLSPVDPKLAANTHTFLGIVVDMAIADRSITRFKVVGLTLKKESKEATSSEHEYVRVRVLDTTTQQESQIFVERTVSDVRVVGNIFERFISHPNSNKLLDSITSAVDNEPPSSESCTPSTSHPSPSSSQLSIPDKISLAVVGIAHASSSVSSEQSEASDQILGKINRHGEDLREITPEGLYLLHLAFIIDSVHNQGPLYSLFQRQCYWFAHLICNAVVHRFPSKDVYLQPRRDKDQVRVYGGSPQSRSGRWRGILISRVEGTVLPSVLAEYDGRFLEFQGQVIFSPDHP